MLLPTNRHAPLKIKLLKGDVDHDVIANVAGALTDAVFGITARRVETEIHWTHKGDAKNNIFKCHFGSRKEEKRRIRNAFCKSAIGDLESAFILASNTEECEAEFKWSLSARLKKEANGDNYIVVNIVRSPNLFLDLHEDSYKNHMENLDKNALRIMRLFVKRLKIGPAVLKQGRFPVGATLNAKRPICG